MLTLASALLAFPTGQVMPQRFAASSTRTCAALDSRVEAPSLRTIALFRRSTRDDAVSAEIHAGATIVAPASCKNFLRCMVHPFTPAGRDLPNRDSSGFCRKDSDAAANDPEQDAYDGPAGARDLGQRAEVPPEQATGDHASQ